MCVKKFFKFVSTIFVISVLLMVSMVNAEIKMYDGVGKYVMSDFETPEIAKQRAKLRAEQAARRQAGVYLTSYSRSENFRLAENEISAITNNITNIVGEVKYEKKAAVVDNMPVIIWTATLKANIDTDGILNYINRDEKDKVNIIQQNESLQRDIVKNDNEVEDLKKQAANAKTDEEKSQLKKKFTQAEKDFLAQQKLKEGNQLYYQRKYYEAIKKYNEALELKPNWDWAYNNRGVAYSDLKKYDQAIADYNKALELNPNNADAYNNRGVAYSDLQKYDQAITDHNKAIELNPNYSEAYNNRGVAYVLSNNIDQAIKDFTKAIEINPNYVNAYQVRGLCYQALGENDKAQADLNKAKELSNGK